MNRSSILADLAGAILCCMQYGTLAASASAAVAASAGETASAGAGRDQAAANASALDLVLGRIDSS